MKNDKAQAFEPFELLIFMIFSLFVLVFILGAIAYFDNQKLSISDRRLFDGLLSAANAPDVISYEKPLIVSELYLHDTYSAKGFSDYTGVPKQCYHFIVDSAKKAYSLTADALVLRMNEKILNNIYIVCSFGSKYDGQEECSINCEVFFGILPTKVVGPTSTPVTPITPH